MIISVLASRFTKIFSCILIVFLVGVYIYQVNAQTAESYLVQNNQKTFGKLSVQNNQLEIAAFGANALEKIEAGIAMLNFEKAQTVSYIRVLNNQVVQK